MERLRQPLTGWYWSPHPLGSTLNYIISYNSFSQHTCEMGNLVHILFRIPHTILTSFPSAVDLTLPQLGDFHNRHEVTVEVLYFLPRVIYKNNRINSIWKCTTYLVTEHYTKMYKSVRMRTHCLIIHFISGVCVSKHNVIFNIVILHL